MLYLWDVESEKCTRVAEMPSSTRAVVQVESMFKSDDVLVLGDDGCVFMLSFTMAGCQVLWTIGDATTRYQSIAEPVLYRFTIQQRY